MQRFNAGEAVTVVARFVHLYPADSGTIVATKLDPFRDAFNEYTVRFPDGSQANLFEFQLIEAGSQNLPL